MRDSERSPITRPGVRQVEMVTRAMRATNPRGFMQGASLTASTGYDPRTLEARITAPVLLVVGAVDGESPLAMHGAPLHAALRGSRLEVLPNIGHLPQLEAPDRVNALARSFLETMR